MASYQSKAAASAIIGIFRLLLFVFIIGCLYYGQSLLIPLTLATLLTFLLSPVVRLLEHYIGKFLAIFIVILLLLTSVGMIGYIFTNQIVDFTKKLPDYRLNIENKLNAFHLPQDDSFKRFLNTIENLKTHLPMQDAQPAANLSVKGSSSPVPVNIIESNSTNIASLVTNVLSALLDILGSTGLVFILLIFMLFARQDLRGRLIRLIGSRQISATTRAMDDAAHRVAHFLFVQLLLNFSYGLVVAIGLYFIGIPNAFLWGGFAFLLRFIPYLGIWIAAIPPFIIALAISTNWIMPILTIILFGVLDLITGNFIEPLLYAARTGISAFALIVSAIFWTLLWGPIGLLLSVPITVCMTVLGDHIPKLSFFNVLLSDEKALAVYEEIYQLLLAGELTEVMALINNYLKANSLTKLYDTVFIPITWAAETDYQQELLNDRQLNLLYQNIEGILEYLGHRLIQTAEAKEDSASPPPKVPDYRVACLPVSTKNDELASIMLTHLLTESSFIAKSFSAPLTNEIIAELKNGNYATICVSLVSRASIIAARTLCAQLNRQLPDKKIVLGLWEYTEINADVEEQLKSQGVDSVVFAFEKAIEQFERYREANNVPPL